MLSKILRVFTCRAFAGAAILAFASAAFGQVGWSLKSPEPDALVPFQGVVNPDSISSKPGAMMYPAANGIMLLAAVLTHAAVATAQQSAEKRQQQDTANKVLDPYRDQLSKFRLQDLYREAQHKVRWGEGRALASGLPLSQSEWLVAIDPVYAMTQDQKSLVLDVAVSVRRSSSSEKAAPIIVRAVSQPRDDVDLVLVWNGQEGAALQQESALLLSHALELSLKEAAASEGVPAPQAPPSHSTLRYREGGNEKMERATVIGTFCERKVIRNLRGWIMSVPVASDAAADAPDTSVCVQALPGWR